MLIDTHIHVGQFHDFYFAPLAIHELMEQLDVDYYAVSSTTQCDENYPKVLSEFEKLRKLDVDKVLPVMWITPEALQGNIAWYLESDIKWKMVKIHPFFNKKEWNPKGELFSEVLDIVRELRLPLLIHTGNEDCCKADVYETAIRENPNIKFILAHGRPIESALRIATIYDNAYIDSAFMPVEHMKMFVDSGLFEKLLWGTDMCIPKYFNANIDIEKYYKEKLETFKMCSTKEQFEKVTYKNALKLFGLC